MSLNGVGVHKTDASSTNTSNNHSRIHKRTRVTEIFVKTVMGRKRKYLWKAKKELARNKMRKRD